MVLLSGLCVAGPAACSDEGFCYEPVFGAATVGDIENTSEGVSAIVTWKSDPRDENGEGFYTEAHLFIDDTALESDYGGARADIAGERQIEIFVPQKVLDRPEFESLEVPITIAGCRYNDSYAVTLKVTLGSAPQAQFSEVDLTNYGGCISIDRSAARRPARGAPWPYVLGGLLLVGSVRRRMKARR